MNSQRQLVAKYDDQAIFSTYYRIVRLNAIFLRKDEAYAAIKLAQGIRTSGGIMRVRMLEGSDG
jgi:hypothetical protein